MKTLKTRRALSNAFQVLKDYYGQPRIIYPAKLPAIIERKIKKIPQLKQPKKFKFSKLNLKEIMEAVFWAKKGISNRRESMEK